MKMRYKISKKTVDILSAPVTLFLWVFIAFIIGYGVTTVNILYFSGAMIGIILTVICWKYPKINLILLLIIVSFIYWFTNDLKILPDNAKFVKEFFILILFSRAVFAAFFEKGFLRTPIEVWLILFILLGLLSGLVNGVVPQVILLALRGLFQYALVFISIVWLRRYFDKIFISRLMGIYLVIALIQFPIGLYQLVSEIRSGNFTGSGDSFHGTLGAFGANNLGLFILPILFYVIGRIINEGRWKPINIATVIILVLIPILSSSRFAWLVGFLAFTILWLPMLIKSKRLVFMIALIAIIGGIALFQIVDVYSTYNPGLSYLTVSKLLSVNTVINSFTTPGYGVGLTAWGQLAYKQIMENAPVPILGLGPGSGGSSVAVQLPVDKYYRLFYDYFNLAARHLPPNLPTQVLQTTIEYGPFGILLLFIINSEFFHMARVLFKKKSNSIISALGSALIVQTITMFILSFKDGVWEQQVISMWLWLLGGLAFISYREIKNHKEIDQVISKEGIDNPLEG
jgi:hypothetical protein